MSDRFTKASSYVRRDCLKGISVETDCVRALNWQCRSTGAIVPPLHVGTAFARDESYEQVNGRGYIRDDNPSFEQAEALLCRLEDAADAYLFASGAAACTSALQILPCGSHIIMQDGIYFGFPKWVREHLLISHGMTCEFIPSGDLLALERACVNKSPSIVWIETPANPTTSITDISGASEIAHKFGAYLIVDSTVATPVHSRPLTLGADFVVHSATKSLNGHSDLLAGFIACREDSDFWRRIGEHRQLTGAVIGSFEAYLLVRGMRTLFLRVMRQSATALYIAETLQEEFSDKLEVSYPGLRDHAGYEIACRQMTGGFGSLMSLFIKMDSCDIMDFLSRLCLIKRATSLGGIESLIEHRKTTEGEGSMTADNLLRFSVGIESSEDILHDIRQALK